MHPEKLSAAPRTNERLHELLATMVNKTVNVPLKGPGFAFVLARLRRMCELSYNQWVHG
jgi:hypothetical protein